MTKIPRTHYDRLDQRRLWLTNRIEAKEKTGWETTYDESERDALAAALAVLEPVEDPGHPPIPEGWERVQDGMILAGDKYCWPGSRYWITSACDSTDSPMRAIVIRKIDTTPDPGEGWRIAAGDDWKDERCERWINGGWHARNPPQVGKPFDKDIHYRVPIGPAPKHPPVPEGWRVLGKDEPLQKGDKYHHPHISEGWLESCGCERGRSLGLAYIRRIEPTYRPFASAEEFRPHRDRWVKSKVNGIVGRAVWNDDKRVCIGTPGSNSWQAAFNHLVFDDDGSPFGVEVKP